MRGKTSLVLMEQAIMLLILAVAAAVCIQAFVWSDNRSMENSSRDRALVELQSAADVLKAHKGDLAAAAETLGGSVESGQWTIFWNENWEQTHEAGIFQFYAVTQDSRTAYLGSAALEIRQEDGSVLANMQVCWQEVLP